MVSLDPSELTLKWYRHLQAFEMPLMKDKDLAVLCGQYYGWRWHVHSRNQGISRRDIGLLSDGYSIVHMQRLKILPIV